MSRRRASRARREQRELKVLEWNRRAVRKDPAFERWWEETGFRELNQLLYWRWDPLGVADSFPATEDEYFHYARPIAELLCDGADGADIAHFLDGVEREWMSYSDERQPPRDGGPLREIGDAIVEWHDESRGWHADFGARDMRPPDLR